MTHKNRGRITFAPGDPWRAHWGVSPLPRGAVALGCVTVDRQPGALLRLANGSYAHGFCGNLTNVNDRKAEAAIAAAPKRFGGATVGGGRKSADRAGGRRRSVYIDDDTAAILKQLGDGELSLGIRRAARLLKDEI
jgi:hypothetical protein